MNSRHTVGREDTSTGDWFDPLGQITNEIEIRSWQLVGLDESEARAFKSAGMSPEAAAHWVQLGLNSIDIAAWRTSGFDNRDDVGWWLMLNVEPSTARVLQRCEITADVAPDWIEAAGTPGLLAELLRSAVARLGLVNVTRIVRISEANGEPVSSALAALAEWVDIDGWPAGMIAARLHDSSSRTTR